MFHLQHGTQFRLDAREIFLKIPYVGT